MGPSGCGKSTLLNLLAGLDRATAGEVWLDGERIDQMSETELAQLRRRRIGFVFQFFNLLPTLSAVENVELPLLLVGRRRKDARRSADGLLAELGIGDKHDAAPAQLSGGQQQRVALARALANRRTSCSATSRPATSTRRRPARCSGSCATRATAARRSCSSPTTRASPRPPIA